MRGKALLEDLIAAFGVAFQLLYRNLQVLNHGRTLDGFVRNHHRRFRIDVKDSPATGAGDFDEVGDRVGHRRIVAQLAAIQQTRTEKITNK